VGTSWSGCAWCEAHGRRGVTGGRVPVGWAVDVRAERGAVCQDRLYQRRLKRVGGPRADSGEEREAVAGWWWRIVILFSVSNHPTTCCSPKSLNLYALLICPQLRTPV